VRFRISLSSKRLSRNLGLGIVTGLGSNPNFCNCVPYVKIQPKRQLAADIWQIKIYFEVYILSSDVSLVSAPLRSSAYINFGAPLQLAQKFWSSAPLRSSSHKTFGAPLRSSRHKIFGAPLRYSWPSSAPLCSSIRAHSCSSTVKVSTK